MTSSVVVLSLIGAAILLADVTTATGCLSCSKVKIGDVVVRGCGSTSSVELCVEVESLSTYTCTCSTDYCNTASHVTVTMVTALLLALVAMVFRF
ncbi:hypothetical protein MAR_000266 [Mya arenaria]|uniref:Uncharacterized protein n=1 Tax=Mya arenaria TaxID=6604 RepID=A0ABY7FCL8_MYAAR|nr:hypothetical protein MAR_000266 [Mya arenaria]